MSNLNTGFNLNIIFFLFWDVLSMIFKLLWMGMVAASARLQEWSVLGSFYKNKQKQKQFWTEAVTN